MPLYTYRCDNCGVRFDRQQSYEDRPISRCPECGKKAVHRVYRPVGIVFKGSGFYVTDNRASSATTAKNGASSKKDSSKKGDKSAGETPKSSKD